MDDKRYESVTLPVDNGQPVKVFAEVLVKGIASLYNHRGTYYIHKDSMVQLAKEVTKTVKNARGTFQITDKKYIRILNLMLFDCHISADKTMYRSPDMVRLVQSYNRCKGKEGVVYKQNRKWTQFHGQVFTGVERSNYQIKEFREPIRFGANNSYFIGAGIDGSSPKIFDRTFLTVEAWYMKKYFQGYHEQDFSLTGRDRYDYFVHASLFKLPFGIRYNFTNEFATPYVRFGFVKIFVLDSSFKTVEETQSTTTVLTYSNELQFSFPNQKMSGIWFAAGFSKIIIGKLKGFAEIRYEDSKSFPVLKTASTKSSSVAVGFRF